jgi:hypothetical protein
MTSLKKKADLSCFGEIDDDRSHKATLECICPKCGIRHIMQLNWTGRYTPRKYCKQCRNLIE